MDALLKKIEESIEERVLANIPIGKIVQGMLHRYYPRAELISNMPISLMEPLDSMEFPDLTDDIKGLQIFLWGADDD